jgi:O-succinylbenzoic acid--CoA ligase
MADILKKGNKDDLFLSSNGGDYTYADLHSFARYFGGILQQHDIGKDQPVGLCTHSSDELIFIIAACWLQGIPFVSFNPRSPKATLGDQINQLECPLIITDDSGPNTDAVQSIDIDNLNLDQVLGNDSVSSVHAIDIDTLNVERVLGNDLKSSGESDDESSIGNMSEENIFGYFFTSGTSCSPKIVPLKRKQMISAARSSAQNLHPETNELWLLCLPLYHIGGISVILRSLLYGSGIYRLDDFDAEESGRLLSENTQVTAASLVPTMLKRLMEQHTFSPHPQLKGILLGGGPMPPELLAKCIDQKIPVIPSYGMTETCAQIAANPLFSAPEDPELFRSAGRIFPPNLIEIRDEKGQQATKNSSGVVWLKGPQVFDGYINNADSMIDTSSFNSNGWFYTGDFGRLNDQGRLFIEARRTDLIISGGENVSPYEVEQVIKAIPGIREAAVIGLPDEIWGQKVAAAVVFEESKSRSKSELRKILKERLEEFKVPKEIIAVESLPRTETGKVKRSELSTIFRPKK